MCKGFDVAVDRVVNNVNLKFGHVRVFEYKIQSSMVETLETLTSNSNKVRFHSVCISNSYLLSLKALNLSGTYDNWCINATGTDTAFN
ncbi:hypothetical protein BB561_001706 [Smittium simulii]|uniref:Uncharacterized protein n=1 Tax=Smittium simulii TaxID=133385 RepID=A0A2T9YTB8_9FUNG|nr:hypothetical protein BB561_001706 [Smittium simulii]